MQRELSARGGRSTSGIGPCCRGSIGPRPDGGGRCDFRKTRVAVSRPAKGGDACREGKRRSKATGSLTPGERKARMCLQLRFAVGSLLQTGTEGGCCVKNARPDGVGVTRSRGRLSDSSAIFTRKGLDLGVPGRRFRAADMRPRPGDLIPACGRRASLPLHSFLRFLAWARGRRLACVRRGGGL